MSKQLDRLADYSVSLVFIGAALVVLAQCTLAGHGWDRPSAVVLLALGVYGLHLMRRLRRERRRDRRDG